MEPLYLSFFYEESTPVYGGVKGTIYLKTISSIKQGNTSNCFVIHMPNHSGTHLDFPRHFDDNGKSCSDYPPSFWIFEKVGFLDCSIEEVPYKIESLPNDIELLILKTGFGRKRNEEVYWSSQPVIPSSFAAMFRLTFPRLRLFGFDLISLTSKLDREEGKLAHQSFLLDENILILEDMKLDCLFTTPKTVIVAPLLFDNLDGAPCTVISFQ